MIAFCVVGVSTVSLTGWDDGRGEHAAQGSSQLSIEEGRAISTMSTQLAEAVAVHPSMCVGLECADLEESLCVCVRARVRACVCTRGPLQLHVHLH